MWISNTFGKSYVMLLHTFKYIPFDRFVKLSARQQYAYVVHMKKYELIMKMLEENK